MTDDIKDKKMTKEEEEWVEKTKWADLQVKKYSEQFEIYERYADILKTVLEEMTARIAPESIVQARPKAISSFAGKIWRKLSEVKDPVNEFTDLCGARIIAHDRDGVLAVCEYIKSHFKIDEANSVMIEQRLKPTEFWYRSIHYIIQFKDDVPSEYYFNTKIPNQILPFKAEIQIRTLFEHSWADFSHSISYKKSFLMPDDSTREMAKLAALIEEADSQLIRVKTDLGHYLSSYGTYMTKDQIELAMKIQKNLLKHDPGNVSVTREIARLHFELGQWEEAASFLKPLYEKQIPSAMRDYGIALCNWYSYDKNCVGYREGQDVLHKVTQQYPKDLHALCSLAASYRNINEYTAEIFYKQAFEIAPDNPYPLSYYLDYLVFRQDLSVVTPLYPILRRAYRKSRDLADANLDTPWTYFNMGKFSLLLDEDCNAVYQYSKALQSSNTSHPVKTALDSLNLFAPKKDRIKGYLTVCTLLKLGLDTKFSEAPIRNIPDCCVMNKEPIRGPVVIIAGTTQEFTDEKRDKLKHILEKGFKNFTGTIISGGTTAGVSGLVGDLQERYKGILKTAGYYPGGIPMGRIILDSRYESHRKTPADNFSALEAAQYWTDIIGSDILPADVRVIGIGGGPISTAEYYIALALGAQVGIFDGSGGAAEALQSDNDWKNLPGIIRLLCDGETIRAFISKDITLLNADEREDLARKNHKYYQDMQGPHILKTIPSLLDWEQLDKDLQESNRKWVDHTSTKLKEFGYSLRKSEEKSITPVTFSEEQIEIMAEMEHGRWIVERIRQGWRYGKIKNIEKKISPYLIPWDQLSKEVQGWDRDPIRKLPQMLAEFGYEIYQL